MIAVDTATGRIVWSSGDVPGIADLLKASIDDAAHVVTIVGVHVEDECGSGMPVAVRFDQQSGRVRGRAVGPFLGEHPPFLVGPVVAKDADTTYRVMLHQAQPRLLAVGRETGATRWSRDFPNPNRVFATAQTVAGVIGEHTLFVAVTTAGRPSKVPPGCLGGD